MRISDWSSDVCSSDLRTRALTTPPLVGQRQPRRGGRRSSPSLPSRGEDRPGPSKYQTPSSAKRGDGRPFPIAARRTAAQGTDHGLFQILPPPAALPPRASPLALQLGKTARGER